MDETTVKSVNEYRLMLRIKEEDYSRECMDSIIRTMNTFGLEQTTEGRYLCDGCYSGSRNDVMNTIALFRDNPEMTGHLDRLMLITSNGSLEDCLKEFEKIRKDDAEFEAHRQSSYLQK